MKTASPMFELNADGPRVPVSFDGRLVLLRDGENLAAQLLAAGIGPFRHTPVSGAPRNPYCMMGACYDCIVEIDGVTRQACMTRVQRDMVVSVPNRGAQ